MRIAVVTTSWPSSAEDPSGHFIRTEVEQLRCSFKTASHDVTVIHGKGDAFGWPGVLPRLRENPLRAFGAARWMVEARDLVRTGKFDRVVAHWAVPSGLLALDADGEVELVSHGSDVAVLLSLPALVRHRLVRSLVERASIWRFVSQALLDRLACVEPCVSERAIVRPCAIDLPDVREEAEEKRRSRAPFVSTVGRLVASKRIDRIVEIAGVERTPLVVVGDGPERARLERAAMRHRTDAHFVGRVGRHEALAWMAASRSLWFASREEGLPTVLREAEALGVPVRML